MDALSREMTPEPVAETPGTLLDALRDHPEWDARRRAEQLDLLIQRFPPDQLNEAARGRLGNLSGGDGEAVLRLIEALAVPDLFEALASALVEQPDLTPERAWDAFGVLQGSGLIEASPDLAERWDELAEAIEDDHGLLGELAKELEGDDPDRIWMALQGMGSIEPEVRAEIIEGLAKRRTGPGLIEFLRLLTFVNEPTTQAAALKGLADWASEDSEAVAAWAAIAADHPDPDVAARARRWLGSADGTRHAPAARSSPRLGRSLVTSVDGRGQGYVVLTGEDRGRWVAAAFLCDVLQGVREVVGQVGHDADAADVFVAEFAARPQSDVVEGAPELALGLLSGCLTLRGPTTTPALRFWLEGTVGPNLRPRPFPGLIRNWEPAHFASTDPHSRASGLLASCRSWVDDSDLTYDLAEELLLREGDVPPDPKRDSGAYRFLFEHRLLARLELYRRMLSWMASFWHAAGEFELGRSALAMAWELSDAQHAVPGHPFTVALASRSLESAQEHLRRGIDLRDPETRSRLARGLS